MILAADVAEQAKSTAQHVVARLSGSGATGVVAALAVGRFIVKSLIGMVVTFAVVTGGLFYVSKHFVK